MIVPRLETDWRIWRTPVSSDDGLTSLGSREGLVDYKYTPSSFPGVPSASMGNILSGSSFVYSSGGATLTKVGVFALYLRVEGDVFIVSSGPYAGTSIPINSIVSDDAVTPGTPSGPLPDGSYTGQIVRTRPIVLDTQGASYVKLRMFGTGTAKTGSIIVSGWGRPVGVETPGGPGKGFVLYSGTVTSGSQATTEAPIKHGHWANSSLYEISQYTDVNNPAECFVLEDGLQQAVLMIPTLGHPRLALEMFNLGNDGAGELTSLGAIVQLVSFEGVVQ